MSSILEQNRAICLTDKILYDILNSVLLTFFIALGEKMLLQRIMRHRGVKPFTRINVKPYTVIILDHKIFCQEDGIPLVFDTQDFAKCFAEAYELKDCEFPEMELEQLARMCRNPKFPFDSFYLIDDKSQLGID